VRQKQVFLSAQVERLNSAMCGMHDDPSMNDAAPDFLDEIIEERTESNPNFPSLVEEAYTDLVNRLCKHVQYHDGHCVHEACWNYYSKCPRHAGIFPEMKEICTQEDRI
jgi:hypothetical protein